MRLQEQIELLQEDNEFYKRRNKCLYDQIKAKDKEIENSLAITKTLTDKIKTLENETRVKPAMVSIAVNTERVSSY
jgi:hypothetical protein